MIKVGFILHLSIRHASKTRHFRPVWSVIGQLVTLCVEDVEHSARKVTNWPITDQISQKFHVKCRHSFVCIIMKFVGKAIFGSAQYTIEIDQYCPFHLLSLCRTTGKQVSPTSSGMSESDTRRTTPLLHNPRRRQSLHLPRLRKSFRNGRPRKACTRMSRTIFLLIQVEKTIQPQLLTRRSCRQSPESGGKTVP